MLNRKLPEATPTFSGRSGFLILSQELATVGQSERNQRISGKLLGASTVHPSKPRCCRRRSGGGCEKECDWSNFILSYYFTTGSTASAIIAAFHAGPDLHSTTQDMHT